MSRAVGAAVRGHRMRLGLTQDDLAAALHTSHTTISNLERGERPLLFEDVIAVCGALGLGLRDLLWAMDPEDIAKLRL